MLWVFSSSLFLYYFALASGISQKIYILDT